MEQARGMCPSCKRIWPIHSLIRNGFVCHHCGYQLKSGSEIAVVSAYGKVLTPCTAERAEKEVTAGRARWDAEGVLRLYDAPEHNALYRQEVFERDSSTCLWCGDRADTVDHIIPYSDGGPYYPVNLLSACGQCNQKRQNDDAYLFLELLAGEGRPSPYAGYVVERCNLAYGQVVALKESQERDIL